MCLHCHCLLFSVIRFYLILRAHFQYPRSIKCKQAFSNLQLWYSWPCYPLKLRANSLHSHSEISASWNLIGAPCVRPFNFNKQWHYCKKSVCLAGIYLFKVNNGTTKTKNDIFSKLIIKTPGRRSGVSIFKFEQILHIVRVNKWKSAGWMLEIMIWNSKKLLKERWMLLALCPCKQHCIWHFLQVTLIPCEHLSEKLLSYFDDTKWITDCFH